MRAGPGELADLGGVASDRLGVRRRCWKRLEFSVRPGGQRLHVAITPGKVEYSLDGEEPVDLVHCFGKRREELTVRPGEPVSRGWTPVKPLTPHPSQPPGREPLYRA